MDDTEPTAAPPGSDGLPAVPGRDAQPDAVPALDLSRAPTAGEAAPGTPSTAAVRDTLAISVAGERVDVSDSLVVALAAGEVRAKDSLVLLCATGDIDGENVRVVLTPAHAAILGAAAGLVLALLGRRRRA
ncbi:hypothetical protein DCC79_10225 [bacterium]|nr:hypothetical protein [Chloroflexi bacterium CFX6]RIL09698.1 MAG: hypothetical protein DCC79_10225 [bacterium]